MSLMGTYSAEAISAEATNIKEMKLGLNAAIFAEEWISETMDGTGSQSWTRIDAWLDRADAVGAPIFFRAG